MCATIMGCPTTLLSWNCAWQRASQSPPSPWRILRRICSKPWVMWQYAHGAMPVHAGILMPPLVPLPADVRRFRSLPLLLLAIVVGRMGCERGPQGEQEATGPRGQPCAVVPMTTPDVAPWPADVGLTTR